MIQKNKTFASFAFGCRVNQAEKEMLDRQLLSAGFSLDPNNPNLYLINTCAVTGKAEREARQLVYQLKRVLPQTKIIVTGCAATKWINENIKVEGVDWIIDNNNKEYIAQLLQQKLRISDGKMRGLEGEVVNPKKIILEANLSRKSKQFLNKGINWPATGETSKEVRPEKFVFEDLPNTTDKFINSGRLLVKIQDGCQRFCTFCIVPYLRGQPKSERITDIVKRIKNYELRIKEVILTAINTQAYGYDTGESFIDLLDNIIAKTKVPRISFGSIHPWSINDDFFRFYRSTLEHERLVKFFHIPLQSGSNKILSYMKRGYSREEFMEKLKTLERIHPMTFIGTDIIAGFLEETDKDFEDTYDFLSETPISRFHAFRFDRREKTAAYFMAKRLAEPTAAQKRKRVKALISLSQRKYHKFLGKHVGKTLPALFLEKRKNGFQEALLDNQIPALIKSEKDLTAQIREVQIEEIKEGKLMGKI